jgi:hypothetical protein
MSRLTAAERRKRPARDFAGPDKTFPDYDRKHQRAAISGASRAYHAGHISKATEQRIQARERRKLSSRSTRKGSSR